MRYTIASVDELNTKGADCLRNAHNALEQLRSKARGVGDTRAGLANVRLALTQFEALFNAAAPHIKG